MRRLLFCLITLSVIALADQPRLASAQQQTTETVIIQIDGQTPAGTSVIGTVVLKRNCSANETKSEASFNGMMNGQPATFSGAVIERWLGNGTEEIEVLSTDIKGIVHGNVPVRKILLVQLAPNSISLDGIPVAINGTWEPPCGGRTSYVVTNAGQGTRSILQLPNTAAELIQPQNARWFDLAAVLILVGASVVAMLFLRKARVRA